MGVACGAANPGKGEALWDIGDGDRERMGGFRKRKTYWKLARHLEMGG